VNGTNVLFTVPQLTLGSRLRRSSNRSDSSVRGILGAYDAFYVAAAHVYDASLLTADGPLARAPALGIVVQNIRLG